MVDELNKIIEKEKSATSFFRWYSNLRQELLNNYNIIIDEEFGNFAKIIKDFWDYKFDPLKIINDYIQIESLGQERDHIL